MTPKSDGSGLPPGWTLVRRGRGWIAAAPGTDPDAWPRQVSRFVAGAGRPLVEGTRGGAHAWRGAGPGPGGREIVARRWRPGGLLRRVRSSTGSPARLRAELETTLRARLDRAPVPEPLAAFHGLDDPPGSWLVTVAVAGGRPLDPLSLASRDARPLRAAVGRAVAALHEAGVDHRDLHVGNLLAAGAARNPLVWILDLDKARRRQPLPFAARADNWVRLARSAVKRGVPPNRRALGALIEALKAYAAAIPALDFRGLRRRVVGAARRQIRLRRLLWRPPPPTGPGGAIVK